MAARKTAAAHRDSKPRRVLVVEDNLDFNSLAQTALSNAGFAVKGVRNGAEALEDLSENPDCALLLDQNLPDMKGTDLLQSLEKAGRAVPFVVMTGYGSEDLAVEMMKRGAKDYLVKGPNLCELLPGIFQNIFKEIDNERQLALVEKSLRQSERDLRTILDSIGDGVIAADRNGRITLINPVGEQLTGWSFAEAVGRPVNEIFHVRHDEADRDHDDAVTRALTAGKSTGRRRPARLVARDGSERLIASSISPIKDRPDSVTGVVLVFEDITEKQRIEQELFKASRLEAIGILAGGIAHDFNNILTGLQGNIELARLKIPEDHPASKNLASTNRALTRATELTRQLLPYAAGGAPLTEKADLARVVGAVLDRHQANSHIRIVTAMPDRLWAVNADPHQLCQAIENLVINASQAMPEGGTLTVEAINSDTLVNDSLAHIPGDFVRLIIRDEGIGISPNDVDKIFDPYYTTKSSCSGLGLTTVHKIVTRHRGLIRVESEPGTGTTFTLDLPAYQNKQTAGEEMPPGPAVATQDRTNRILVMDDEQMIRDLAVSMLESQGYRVDVAEEGRRMLEKYKAAQEEGSPYDMVIIDLNISDGMDGKTAIRELRHLDPAASAVVTSGYASDPVLANYEAFGFKGRLAKPFEFNALVAEVERVTDRGKAFALGRGQ